MGEFATHMELKAARRIYVWAVNVHQAKARARQILREQGHIDPLPELSAKRTGLLRPGSYEVDVAAGYGEYAEVIGDTSRRYAVDPII